MKGLSEKTTSDGIQCYMELISGVDVLTVVFGEQGCALLTFNETLSKFNLFFVFKFKYNFFSTNAESNTSLRINGTDMLL